MLASLSVRNYAIIRDLTVEFGEGLNILTGETGAGKSIIIGALSLALGYRSSSDAIRTGQDRASVSAEFTLSPDEADIFALLDEFGIDPSPGSLILRRDVYENGRNVCRINDVSVAVGTLRRISQNLIDIHGQHEHQKLMNQALHMSFLDSYGARSIAPLKDAVREAAAQVREKAGDLERLRTMAADAARNRLAYESAAGELGQAALKAGEDEAIESRIRTLSNAGKLFGHVSGAYGTLYGLEPSVAAMLTGASGEISKACEVDPALEAALKNLEEAMILVDEATITLRSYRESLEFEPEELDSLHARLSRLNSLKRKYGQDLPGLISHLAECEASLSLFDGAREEIEKAEKAHGQACAWYLERARALSEERRRLAADFSREVASALGELAMPSAVFEAKVDTDEEKVSGEGIDNVTFLISTNPGQEPKSLSRVASGGEISRIMLAIKTILADSEKTGVLIFDEVDTGISGRTAQVVAQKMHVLSRSRQILCITHLPQIASMADYHYRIVKTMDEKNTYTTLEQMPDEERAVELARMLGGVEVTGTTLDHAREVLSMARDYKTAVSKDAQEHI